MSEVKRSLISRACLKIKHTAHPRFLTLEDDDEEEAEDEVSSLTDPRPWDGERDLEANEPSADSLCAFGVVVSAEL